MRRRIRIGNGRIAIEPHQLANLLAVHRGKEILGCLSKRWSRSVRALRQRGHQLANAITRALASSGKLEVEIDQDVVCSNLFAVPLGDEIAEKRNRDDGPIERAWREAGGL